MLISCRVLKNRLLVREFSAITMAYRSRFKRKSGSSNSSSNQMANESVKNVEEIIDLRKYMANSLLMDPPPPPPAAVSCGQLRESFDGKTVELTGRVTRKKMGRFAELRDNQGVTQLVISEERFPTIARRFVKIREGSLITVVGEVLLRPKNSVNRSLPTGDVEVLVQDILKYIPEKATSSFQYSIANKRAYSTQTATKSKSITSAEFKIAKSENIVQYFNNRDLTCNDLRFTDTGKTVELVGWVPTKTNSKFVQLKDGYGQTQIVVENEGFMETIRSSADDAVFLVRGRVLARPRANVNVKYDTGDIELFVEQLKLLDPSEPYNGPGGKSVEVDLSQKQNNNEEEHKSDFNKFTCRTHNCGELTAANINQDVVVCGWLEFQRMKKFVVLRDGYGKVQIMLPDSMGDDIKVDEIPFESILKVTGTVHARPNNMINSQMKTGEIEIVASSVEILNKAKSSLPIEVREFNRSKESLRLAHRYIDLRFPDMQRNLRFRSDFVMKMREYLINKAAFVEVETPTLFRKTPGGAQEFIVPTRKPGHFYSLVQSPQQFKQMLMAGAIDRYFQVARCYRDEATRPERQPEFTQLDIELSFTDRQSVMHLVEQLLDSCWPKDTFDITIPFPRISYQEAMDNYGTDKPDIRYGYKIQDISHEANTGSHMAGEQFGAYAIVLGKPESAISNAALQSLKDVNKNFDCKMLIRKAKDDPVDFGKSILGKIFSEEVGVRIVDKLKIEPDNIVVLTYGNQIEAQSLAGALRIALHDKLVEVGIIQKEKDQFKFLWVTDFPMFETNKDTGSLDSVHHPFTAVQEDDLELLKAKSNLTSIRSQAYDLVLNGSEIGGGSIRIHDYDLQLFVLEDILKIEHGHLQHLLDALQSGCPPHGGIALGIDRLISILCGTKSIRDVMAFPKGSEGKDFLSQAPVPISDEEKELYFIEVKKPE